MRNSCLSAVKWGTVKDMEKGKSMKMVYRVLLFGALIACDAVITLHVARTDSRQDYTIFDPV